MKTVNATTDYRCMSTDDKPTEADINALLLEVDTGEFYYFDGENWGKVGGTTEDSGRNANNTKSDIRIDIRTEPREEIKAEIGEEEELNDRSEYEPTKGGDGE